MEITEEQKEKIRWKIELSIGYYDVLLAILDKREDLYEELSSMYDKVFKVTSNIFRFVDKVLDEDAEQYDTEIYRFEDVIKIQSHEKERHQRI